MIADTGHRARRRRRADRRPGGARRSGCCSGPRPRAAPTTPRTSSGAARRSTPTQTAPLIEVYRERGLLVEVDGMGEVDEVTERIFAALDVVPES